MSDWLPMDSAPKDGRDVVLLIRHRNYYLDVEQNLRAPVGRRGCRALD